MYTLHVYIAQYIASPFRYRHVRPTKITIYSTLLLLHIVLFIMFALVVRTLV